MRRLLSRYFHGEFGKNSLLALAIKITSRASDIVTSIMLARLFTIDTLGKYSQILALIGVIKLPILLGFPFLLLREISRSRRSAGVDFRILTTGIYGILTSFVFFSTLIVVAQKVAFPNANSGLFLLILLAVVALTFFVSIIQGYDKVIVSQVCEFVVKPVLLLALILLSLLLDVDKNIELTMKLLFIALLFSTLMAGAIFVDLARPSLSLLNPMMIRPAYFRKALPFLLIGGVHTLNTQVDILMLSYFVTDVQVGIYKVALNGGHVIVLIMTAMFSVILPRIAGLYKDRSVDTVQDIINNNFKRLIIVVTPLLVVLLLFGEIILGQVWGEIYAAGYAALTILAAGLYLHSLIGAPALLLSVTGNERETLRGAILVLTINILINPVLILQFGISGAALGTVSSILIGQVFWTLRLKTKTGLSPFYRRIT